MNETAIVKEIQVALADAKRGKTRYSRLFRNNVGLYRNPNGQVVRFGLCKGSSDLIGITPLVITPEMVGRTIGIFTAVEVKVPGKDSTPYQKLFIDMVQTCGGIAFVAHSADEAEHKLANI